MRVILVIIVCLLATGCRTDRRNSRETALLRAEILDLEDKYYLLKSRQETAVNGFNGIPGEIIYDDQIIIEDQLLNDSLGSASDASQIIGMPGQSNAQQVRFENQSSIQNPGRPIQALDDLQINVPDVHSFQAGVSDRDQNANVEITEVLIHRLVSEGHDVDGQPGDEGMELLIQPRTAGGIVVPETGELTVSVLDPAEHPDRQRIGLWKFLPGETELFFANDESGNRGILLHLPWELRTPVNPRLIVHVRLVARDGQTLKTSTDIRITPPAADYSPDDPLVSSWTDYDSRWVSGQDQQRSNSPPAKTATQKPRWRPVR